MTPLSDIIKKYGLPPDSIVDRLPSGMYAIGGGESTICIAATEADNALMADVLDTEWRTYADQLGEGSERYNRAMNAADAFRFFCEGRK